MKNLVPHFSPPLQTGFLRIQPLNYLIRIAVIIAVLLIWLPLAMMVLYYLAETDVVITTVTFMAVLLVPAAITCWFRREALSLWKWWLVLALTPILVVPNFSLSIAFLLYLTLLLSAWRPVPKVGN